MARASGGKETSGRPPPSWDGNPERWQTYKDEVRIWTLGTNLDVGYCVAARLVSALRGSARRVGLSMADNDLEPDQGAEASEGVPARPKNLKKGIQNLMARLQTLAPADTKRRGGYMKEFFKDEKYRRRQGERIAEWISRWEEGVERLSQDGIDFLGTDDLAGWFFLEQAALGEEWLELVGTIACPDGKIDLDVIVLKSTVLRPFPNIHVRESKRHDDEMRRGRNPRHEHRRGPSTPNFPHRSTMGISNSAPSPDAPPEADPQGD